MTWKRGALVGIAPVALIGITSIVLLSAPGKAAIGCSGPCMDTSPGLYSNSSAATALLPAEPLELRQLLELRLGTPLSTI